MNIEICGSRHFETGFLLPDSALANLNSLDRRKVGVLNLNHHGI
jgi:hypothetical protein